MKKNAYIAPEAEFVRISTASDILVDSTDYGTEMPADYVI